MKLVFNSDSKFYHNSGLNKELPCSNCVNVKIQYTLFFIAVIYSISRMTNLIADAILFFLINFFCNSKLNV